MGNRIWWKRDQHTLQSFFLSVIACIMCVPAAADVNNFLLCWTFGDEIGDQLTGWLLPLWALQIWWQVPNVFLMDSIDN